MTSSVIYSLCPVCGRVHENLDRIQDCGLPSAEDLDRVAAEVIIKEETE
jgi:hypothetical protein